MFIYTGKDNESDKRIKNDNKTHQIYKNTFQQIQISEKYVQNYQRCMVICMALFIYCFFFVYL